MTNYQGPHAAVTQQFVPTPAAVSIEDLPSVCIGTAFDVYAKEVMGSSFGIIDNELLWEPIEKVVYDKDVIDQKAYDFYPVVVYAETPFGDIELELADDAVASTGVTIEMDDAYTVPGTEQAAGACEGIIPYYKQELSAGDVRIEADNLSVVIVDGGYMATAQVRPGQRVYINISSTWTPVGVIGSVGNDETRIRLASPYSTPITTTGEGIIIGAADETASLRDIPDTIYDPNADFITARVRVGDVVKISTQTISTSIDTPIEATIVSIIDRNTIRFNTTELTTGLEDSDFLKYKRFSETPGNTLLLYTYWIERFVGFSQNYQFKKQNSDVGVQITYVNDSTFTYLQTVGTATPVLKIGDPFIITVNNQVIGTDDRTVAANINRVKSIVNTGLTWTVTVDGDVKRVDGATITGTDEFIAGWAPKIESDVKVDFRAVREEELGVPKRITSIKDIADAWTKDGEIGIHNELAFMASIIFGLNGGKVFYGGNVDATADNPSAEYSDILEEFKLLDVYSHAFGTTDAGVNAIVGPYCDNQADPYEGHERIAVLCYDEDDIYFMGSDGCAVSDAGVITIDGVLDTLGIGLTVSDIAKIYDANGDLVDTVTVTETPDPGDPNAVQTDYDGATLNDTHSVQFFSGRRDDRAQKIAAINYGNRRIATIWPGWFAADFSGERYTLPPYYITAAIVAMDSAIGVAQSFTNMSFSIPGLSNISLNTNHYFRKLELDEIGSGGIDIMIQDAASSQSIKSRHDLTSNMDAILYRERSITKQADVAAKTIRNAIAPYVGRYNITDDLFRFIGQVISIVITKLLKDGILNNLTMVDIARDENIADKINIVMEATVFVAGNYYDVTLIVKS